MRWYINKYLLIAVLVGILKIDLKGQVIMIANTGGCWGFPRGSVLKNMPAM